MSGSFGNGRGPAGPAGATGAVGPNRAFAWTELSATSAEIDQAAGETLVISDVLTTVSAGSVVAVLNLVLSGIDASAVVALKIDGQAYSNVVMKAITVDPALSLPFTIEGSRAVVADRAYTISAYVTVTGAGFAEAGIGTSLRIQEVQASQ